MIRTAFIVVSLILLTGLVGPPLILYTAITRSTDLLYRVGVGGVLLIFRVAGMRTKVEGSEHIPPGACLFVANHTSLIDPLAVVYALRSVSRRVGVLIKKSVFSIPIVGFAFRMAHFIPVDRAHPAQAIESMNLATEHLKSGLSFLVYPEGTRSMDGRLLRFKGGALAPAIRAGVPVVPVACVGAHRILPKKSLRIRPGEILVRFCPPIDASAYTLEQRGELALRVHTAIAAALPADQQPLVAVSPQPAL
jgi:1-acyl-sn-glycerol-3-phosphate acyltransferase